MLPELGFLVGLHKSSDVIEQPEGQLPRQAGVSPKSASPSIALLLMRESDKMLKFGFFSDGFSVSSLFNGTN